jgi:hypothetical protein
MKKRYCKWIATEALDRKARELDKELKDSKDLFGDKEAKGPAKLIDEGIDPNVRKKATEKEHLAIKLAKEEVKKDLLI